MSLEVNDFIELMARIADQKNLKATFSQSLKGGLLTGASATVGGLLLGPVGLAVGGIVGGTLAAASAKGNFKSVSEVLYNLSPRERENLYNAVCHVFRNVTSDDLVKLAVLIMSSNQLKELALKETINYLQRNLCLTIN